MAVIALPSSGFLLSLTLEAKDGTILHQETYSLPHDRIMPVFPDVGEIADIVIGATSHPTKIKHKRFTYFVDPSGLVTTQNVIAVRTS